jgi:hypothetical protein
MVRQNSLHDLIFCGWAQGGLYAWLGRNSYGLNGKRTDHQDGRGATKKKEKENPSCPSPDRRYHCMGQELVARQDSSAVGPTRVMSK